MIFWKKFKILTHDITVLIFKTNDTSNVVIDSDDTISRI